MQLDTKFDLNDKVHKIWNKQIKTWEECEACSGKGRIILNDKKERQCPECYGRKGTTVFGNEKWQLDGCLTIGKVCCEMTNITPTGMFDNVGEYEEGKTKKKVSYMAYETGVGSGTIHYEKTLFAEESEAQKECDRLNANQFPVSNEPKEQTDARE